jgi:MarR family transcriptional regulator, organic hydroperoxide resistance regulator
MSEHASRAPVGDQDEWPTGRLLSMAARLVEGAWADRLAAQGLTHAGLMALHELQSHDSLPVQELASRSQVTPQTMTRTLDRLERDGLVTRHRAADDRRRVEVSVTPAGRHAHVQAVDMAGAEPELLGDVVDLAALRANLLAIIDHLGAGGGRTLPG